MRSTAHRRDCRVDCAPRAKPRRCKMRVDVASTAVAIASFAASGLVPQAPVCAPAPRTPDEMLRREAIDGAVTRAWRSLDGHLCPEEEEAAIDLVKAGVSLILQPRQ